MIDGATGTELQARGVPMDDAAWCGVANLEYTDVVRDVHEDYIRAGAAVVITNTFSTDAMEELRSRPLGALDRPGYRELFKESRQAVHPAAIAWLEHNCLMRAAEEWSGSPEQADDMTVIIARFLAMRESNA